MRSSGIPNAGLTCCFIALQSRWRVIEVGYAPTVRNSVSWLSSAQTMRAFFAATATQARW